MPDVIPSIAQNLFNAQVQTKEPLATYLEVPCLSVVSNNDSNLTILYPQNIDKVPAMGGSILKISLGNVKESDDYKQKIAAYIEGINSQISSLFNSESLLKIESTSALRVLINRAYVEAINSNLNIDGIPNLYLSSTTEDFALLDPRKDSYGVIRKNAKFSYVPIESIRAILSYISTDSVKKTWSGISGMTYGEVGANQGLKGISNDESPTDDQIISLITDMLPFLNLSEKEMIEEPSKPVLAGYFTIINENIYLKMPDISGIDSAGYSSDYIINSELNFLFQLIIKDASAYSLKNIELKIAAPISADIIEYPEDYSITSSESFSITFSSSQQPKAIYLSPAIDDNKIKIKNTKGISLSQASNYIEYNTYPNPYISIFSNLRSPYIVDNSVIGVDEPFHGSVNFEDVIAKINQAYNDGEQENGPIGNYLDLIDKKKYEVGFCFEPSFLQSSSGVITQSLSVVEFASNLSRQNLILHNGVTANSPKEESSGDRGNNSKYFNKNFIANSVGLCENYRPRVFKSPENFIPVTWIKSTSVLPIGDDSYEAQFSIKDLQAFYSISASKMKFVVYAFDGQNQISKVENGYLSIDSEAPEILNITPDGTIVDAKILKCDNDLFSGQSQITIKTSSAKNISIVKVNGLEIRNDGTWIVTSSSLKITIPCETEIVQGFAKVIISKGLIDSAPFNIYIANGSNTTINTDNIRDLPSEIPDDSAFSAEEVSSENLSIVGQTKEIPICYANPRARIEIKSKKKIFKSGRPIYLYMGFESEEIAKKFSQNNVEITKDGNKIWVAKDFNYELSDSLLSDFYRKSTRKADLFFPGNTNSSKPLSLLYSDVKNAYLVLSTNSSVDFSATAELGVLKLGESGRAFSEPPLVIGMAANYEDSTTLNHINNFNNQTYKTIAQKILNNEIGTGQESVLNPINVYDKFKILIFLLKYRELKKFKKKYFNLYIKNIKVSNLFSFGVKKAADLDLPDSDRLASKNLYYFVLKDLNVTTSESSEVRVDIYDPDFYIINSSQNKYTDYSIRVSSDKMLESTSQDSNSIYFKSSGEMITTGTLTSDGSLFGPYNSDKALTGFFINDYTNSIMNIGTYPLLSVNSTISGTISAVSIPGQTDTTVRLLKYSNSNLLPNIPNKYFFFESGAEVYQNQYLAGKSDFLIFLRLQANDICKLGLLTPKIKKVDKEILVAGEQIIITAENLSKSFVVEILGKKAKIIDISGENIKVIVPEGLPTIVSLDKYCISLYNGNQILNRGINELGKQLAENINRFASGALSKVTNQFEKWKEKITAHPIKFIGTIIDKVNIAKEFLTSFCNFSFKIVADLNINLQGFLQLLIPIRVILCILDVICNLFNPFQLPSAIIRLFECLYDLILMLPQISVPVMFLNLMIHLLDLLECLIVKVLNTIIVINLFIDAIAQIIGNPEGLSFRDLMVLEELLLKYVISVEADMDLLTPIVQVLAIFLQLLQLIFRFPCSINPNSLDAPCGIDGFEVGAMVSGLIAEKVGSEPHATYKFKKEYLIPVAQPFTKIPLQSATPPSYNSATEPLRGTTAFNGTEAVNGNVYDLSYFNPNSLRKKENGFDPNTSDIEDVSTDTYISLSASYTKRRKTLESSQGVIFKFDSRTWKSVILPEIVDKQVIERSNAFDTPIVLFSKDGQTLSIPGELFTGNFYSMLDGKSMMTPPVDGVASILPLTIDLEQNGEIIERTFDTIPAMLLLDEEFNVYVVNEGGIIFGEYKQLDGTTVVGITEIRATVINKQSSTPDGFDKEDEVFGTDTNGDPIVKNIFSLPQLYFVDTRVAAESIQAKCETSSLNQLPLDLSGDGGIGDVENLSKCLGDFLAIVLGQTTQIKNDLSVGNVPTKMSEEAISAAYGSLVDCTNNSINNICSIVVNPLNTSFLLLADNDHTRILPDPSLSTEILSGFQASGPTFTGAREYAAGIGDAATVTTGNYAIVEIIPRDSYDNFIYYDISGKIKIEILSDTTGSAEIKLSPTERNDQNYLIFNENTKSYTCSITAYNPGEVKIRASICNNPIQALTYKDLVSDDEASGAGCVPNSNNTSDSGSIPLGALTRIKRILTITFISSENTKSIIADFGMDGNIITEPQLSGTNLEN